MVSLLFAGYFLYRQGRFLLPFIFAALGYSSHILLDFFSVDTSPPYGIPMFWPFSSEYFVSSIDVFSDVRKSFSTATFFQSLLVSHNVWTVLKEILILGPLVLIFQVYRFFKAKSSKYYARYYQG